MPECPNCQSPKVLKRGYYHVGGPTNHQRVQRFACKSCLKRFSTQTLAMTRGEKKAYINQRLFRTLCCGMSQRSAAFLLGIHRTTVARKIARFGPAARSQLAAAAAATPAGDAVVFDEMETFEHSKCKPLSVAVAVDKATRRILAVEVASMPAKGLLAKIARKRYGRRLDGRAEALHAMCRHIQAACPKVTTLQSDENPRYPAFTKEYFPEARHETSKGRRACVVGQGELKRGGFDPLFALNHTCAMFRDHLKRLSRRTWCTTKKASCLQDLMSIYAWFHNEQLAGRGRLVAI